MGFVMNKRGEKPHSDQKDHTVGVSNRLPATLRAVQNLGIQDGMSRR